MDGPNMARPHQSLPHPLALRCRLERFRCFDMCLVPSCTSSCLHSKATSRHRQIISGKDDALIIFDLDCSIIFSGFQPKKMDSSHGFQLIQFRSLLTERNIRITSSEVVAPFSVNGFAQDSRLLEEGVWHSMTWCLSKRGPTNETKTYKNAGNHR